MIEQLKVKHSIPLEEVKKIAIGKEIKILKVVGVKKIKNKKFPILDVIPGELVSKWSAIGSYHFKVTFDDPNNTTYYFLASTLLDSESYLIEDEDLLKLLRTLKSEYDEYLVEKEKQSKIIAEEERQKLIAEQNRLKEEKETLIKNKIELAKDLSLEHYLDNNKKYYQMYKSRLKGKTRLSDVDRAYYEAYIEKYDYFRKRDEEKGKEVIS